MARIFRRHLGTLTSTGGQVLRLDIPRNHIFKGLQLYLSGTLTKTESAAGTLFTDQPMSLLTLVRLVRNGSEVLQSIDGSSLYRIGQFLRGTGGKTTGVTLGTDSAEAFNAVIPIDFAMLGMVNPNMTLFRAVGTSSVILEVTVGSIANLISGGTYTGVTLNATLDVYGEELLDVAGNYGDREITVYEKLPTATSTEYPVELPLGKIYRRLYIRAMSALGLNTDTLVNKVSVKSDGFFLHFDKIAWNVLQGFNKTSYGIETSPVGWGVVDFAENGRVQGLIDTRAASEFKAIFDITYTSGSPILQVIPEVLVGSKELAES